MEASSGHVPYVIDYIHFKEFEGLGWVSLSNKVWARKQLMLASGCCIKYGAEEPSFRIMLPSRTHQELVI